MMIKWVILSMGLSVSIPVLASTNSTLEELVQKRLSSLPPRPQTLETSFGFEGYIPIQNFEYQYGWDEDAKEDSHTLKINLKSFKEMSTFWESRKISQDLRKAGELEIANQNRFDVYMSIVQQALYYKMVVLFGAREKDLNKSVEQASQMLGLPKANAKDLINELQRLHKVTSEERGVKSQAKKIQEIDAKQFDALVESLIQNIGPISKNLSSKPLDAEPLSIQKKRLELSLDKINKEISWADDRKILRSLDIRQDLQKFDNSYRINFNIPWIRFDGENFARESVLHYVDEQDFQRDSLKAQGDLERKRIEVQGLGAQAESTKERLNKTREMLKKVRRIKDIEFRRLLNEMGFDLERDLLIFSLKFYTEYLEYLSAGGYLADGDVNILDPKWMENGFKTSRN